MGILWICICSAIQKYAPTTDADGICQNKREIEEED